jgi:hypothetical protein
MALGVAGILALPLSIFPLVPNPNVLARMASQLLADLDGERLHGPSPNLAAISLHSGKDHALENLVAVDILRPFHHSTLPPLHHSTSSSPLVLH